MSVLSRLLRRLGIGGSRAKAIQLGLHVYAPDDCPVRCLWCGQMHVGICKEAMDTKLKEIDSVLLREIAEV